jgi:hypothetical protein
MWVKVPGALHNLKGITTHLNSPLLVLNPVLYSSPSVIHMLLYLALMSNLLNSVLPLSYSRIDCMQGSGVTSMIVYLLSLR